MTKVAIVHDFLAHKDGGAERVLRQLIKLYPEANILTLTFDPDQFFDIDPERVKTSWLSHLPKYFKQNPKYLLPLIRSGLRSLPSKHYDLLIINSSGWSKNIVKKPDATKIVYCNSPNRLIWDSWPSYFTSNLTGLSIFARPVFLLLNFYISRLRLWDYDANQDIDKLIANSSYIAKRIYKYYKLSSQIVYPPVELATESTLDSESLEVQGVKLEPGYFLYLGVLSRYKQVDIIIDSFERLGSNYRLVIAGDGPEAKSIATRVGNIDNIDFLGRVSDQEKLTLFKHAQAFVFPSIEDFGITPLEALSQATPVIARNAGGLKETIKPGTGVLLDQISIESLTKAIVEFDPSLYSDSQMKSVAKQYSSSQFDRAFKNLTKDIDFDHKSRVAILDWMVDPITIEELLGRVKQVVSEDYTQPMIVIKPYVEHFNPSNFTKSELAILNQIATIVPDGIALQWAGVYLQYSRPNLFNLIGSLVELVVNPARFDRVLPEKFAGNDFTLPLLKFAHNRQLRISILGGDDSRGRKKQLNQLFGRFEQLQVINGYYDANQEQEIVDQINQFAPDILFVATGIGKQEKFIIKYYQQLKAKVIVGEGGSFDYDSLGGSQRRAPGFVKRHNLEWAWRLLTSPSGTSTTRLKRQLFIPKFIWGIHQSAKVSTPSSSNIASSKQNRTI
ncbi:WecB/TagA/CpsF family glycosyltransferase [Candidatus Saccharibacteria bacterium]|nr:WecB/TagA/CpsF family glycosyltransferase [Candidatus Saccharibacteria bacterium]